MRPQAGSSGCPADGKRPRGNGADVTVKDSKRYAATGGWGYFDFNHFEPKLKMTGVQPKDKCAFCHIASAKKDEVWTQFYRILDEK